MDGMDRFVTGLTLMIVAWMFMLSIDVTEPIKAAFKLVLCAIWFILGLVQCVRSTPKAPD